MRKETMQIQAKLFLGRLFLANTDISQIGQVLIIATYEN
jgi:hypothetical protein